MRLDSPAVLQDAFVNSTKEVGNTVEKPQLSRDGNTLFSFVETDLGNEFTV